MRSDKSSKHWPYICTSDLKRRNFKSELLFAKQQCKKTIYAFGVDYTAVERWPENSWVSLWSCVMGTVQKHISAWMNFLDICVLSLHTLLLLNLVLHSLLIKLQLFQFLRVSPGISSLPSSYCYLFHSSFLSSKSMCINKLPVLQANPSPPPSPN